MGETETARLFARLDEISRDLAGLRAAHTATADLLEEVRADVKVLGRNGCARGEQHEREIGELRARPEKILGHAAVVASIVSAVVGALAYIIGATQY